MRILTLVFFIVMAVGPAILFVAVLVIAAVQTTKRRTAVPRLFWLLLLTICLVSLAASISPFFVTAHKGLQPWAYLAADFMALLGAWVYRNVAGRLLSAAGLMQILFWIAFIGFWHFA